MYITTNYSTSELWHQRFHHLNSQILAMLSKMNMFDGLPWIKVNKNGCIGCMVGKQYRDKFETCLHGKKVNLLNLSMVIYVGLGIPHQMEGLDISQHSLMFFQGNFGSTSLSKKMKCLENLKFSKNLWKIKVGIR